MSEHDNLLLKIILSGVAFLFFLDEIWMVFPELGIGYPNWILPDLSAFHISIFGFDFHHWMLTPVILVFVWIILPLIKTWRTQR
jgi:hypothetical protein